MVCGMEIHVELNTKTKIFCSCETKFDAAPNEQCCQVCLGMPGTLPSLNEEVVDKAIVAGLATDCKINGVSKFDRKNYFYKDLPKAYQLTQHFNPICQDGRITIESGKVIRIKQIHIEEDAGKIVNKKDKAFVDYNRSGIPLIEIVSHPDIQTPLQAKEYVEKVQMLMRYTNVSDCKMQEGSMRCDVNISVRKKGSTELGVPVEIKNINSKNFVRKTLEYEFKRQVDLLESGQKVIKQTRRYNEKKNVTEPLRLKESEGDYRYFQDPDLQIVFVDKSRISKILKTMPESFDKKLRRYVEEFHLPYQDAKNILKYKKVMNFFDESTKNVKDKRVAANLIINTIFGELKGQKEEFRVGISLEDFKNLLKKIEDQLLSKNEASKLIKKLMKI